MGLLDDFGLNLDEIKANTGFATPDPGFYEFTIGAAFIKDGSVNHPDDQWLIIEYLLTDADGKDGGTTSDMFTLPKDPDNLTKAELTKMGFYKARLLELGFDESDLNEVSDTDLVGLTGTLEVYETKGKGKNADTVYSNIRKVRPSTDDEESSFEQEPEPEPEPEVKVATPRRPRRNAGA